MWLSGTDWIEAIIVSFSFGHIRIFQGNVGSWFKTRHIFLLIGDRVRESMVLDGILKDNSGTIFFVGKVKTFIMVGTLSIFLICCCWMMLHSIFFLRHIYICTMVVGIIRSWVWYNYICSSRFAWIIHYQQMVNPLDQVHCSIGQFHFWSI